MTRYRDPRVILTACRLVVTTIALMHVQDTRLFPRAVAAQVLVVAGQAVEDRGRAQLRRAVAAGLIGLVSGLIIWIGMWAGMVPPGWHAWAPGGAFLVAAVHLYAGRMLNLAAVALGGRDVPADD